MSAPKTAAKRARCRECGARFTRRPNNPGQSYCTPTCRKRAAKRGDAAKGPKTGSDQRKGAAGGGHLGKKTTEFRPPSDLRECGEGPDQTAERDRRAQARKTERYARRRTLWRITDNTSCRGCGRTLMDSESGVIVARSAEGTAVVLGLLRCGKLWLCPVCSAKIRHARGLEITRAAVEWISRGGTVLLVTLTTRHAANDRLAALMDALQGTRADAEAGTKRRPGAYQRLITGAAWAGDKRKARNRDGIRGRVGYVGMIRATEITVGMGAGWHPHIHALVFVGGRTEGERADKRVVEVFAPSPSALAELEDHFRAVWTRALAQVDPSYRPSDECVRDGCPCGGRGHGVDVKQLHTARDAVDFGLYVAKTQDGKDPALEIARGDLKAGRRGSMQPFELLGRIGDLSGGVPEDDAPGHGSLDRCLSWWAEYEEATKGRRAIEWTRYLRPLLGIEGGDSEDDDLDALFALDGAEELVAGARLEERAWHRITRAALDLEVESTVAAGREADVGALVESIGGRSGSVRVLTAAEVREAWEAVLVALATRREAAKARREAAAREAEAAEAAAGGES